MKFSMPRGYRNKFTLLRSNIDQRCHLIALMTALIAYGCSDSNNRPIVEFDPECSTTIRDSLSACAVAVNQQLFSCYDEFGSACADTDLDDALSGLTDQVEASCPTDKLTQAGFNLNGDAIVTQLTEACKGISTTLAARVFGGPQAAVLNDAIANGDTCLNNAYQQAFSYSQDAVNAYQQCLDNGNCASVATAIDSLTADAIAEIDSVCTTQSLAALNGLSAATLLNRTLRDAECQVALANPDLSNLPLSCAPQTTAAAVQAYSYTGIGSTNLVTTELFSATTQDGTASNTRSHLVEPGQYVQIELDAASTGAMCGNSSNYRFWMQLAPAVDKLDNVLVFILGGGSCVDDNSCSDRVLGALAYAQGGSGDDSLTNLRADDFGAAAGENNLLSLSNTDNPYIDWTKIYLPYCTQDIHIGGANGRQRVTVNNNGRSIDYTIRRTGAHNIRESLNYAKNILWGALNAEGLAYNPSSLKVAFSGGSAGGFGVNFNYHYLLDELRWSNATAINLWGLGLDDQSTAGQNLRNLLDRLIPIWDATESLAPYCQGGECVHTEVQITKALPRLDAAKYPRQHYILVSAQVDAIQADSTNYGRTIPQLKNWGDALRSTYCRLRDPSDNSQQDQLHFYLPLTFAHGLEPSQAYAPSNLNYIEWLADWEADFEVEDSVDASSNILINTRTNDGNIELEPFDCL